METPETGTDREAVGRMAQEEAVRVNVDNGWPSVRED